MSRGINFKSTIEKSYLEGSNDLTWHLSNKEKLDLWFRTHRLANAILIIRGDELIGMLDIKGGEYTNRLVSEGIQTYLNLPVGVINVEVKVANDPPYNFMVDLEPSSTNNSVFWLNTEIM
ncbi:MAG: hypothetical protein ACRCZ0_06210 [Cetobacterium sp.]